MHKVDRTRFSLEPDPSKKWIFFNGELGVLEYEELGPQQGQRISQNKTKTNLGATFKGSLKLNKVGTGIEGSIE